MQQSPPTLGASLELIVDLSPKVSVASLAREIAKCMSHFGEDAYSAALHHMVRLVLPTAEAKKVLRDILAHHRRLAKQLGRGVSLITAASDYFTVFSSLLSQPVLVSTRVLKMREESAYKDELTGLFNRRYLNQEIPREIERFRRFGQSFSVLMLDLDRFKQFNDKNGHQAGDQALMCVAHSLNIAARLYDRAIRFGGDEFVMILPQAPLKEALLVAKRIHKAICNQSIAFQGKMYACPTVSIGVASYPQDAMDMQTLINRADQALYRAKQKRNKIATYKDAKRRFPRFHLSRPVQLQMQAPQGGTQVGMAKDISFGGVLCHTITPMESESTIEVLLSDSTLGISLPLRATVKRVEQVGDGEFHIGMAFKINSARIRKDLFSLIDHHNGYPKEPEPQPCRSVQ